jgi:hypothetical protein
MSRELLKQALYALKYHSIQTRPIDLTNETIEALRQELAKPEQEPVAWLHPDKKVDVVVPTSLAWFDKPIPLYTAPPRKPWVGLTDDEIKEVLGLNETSWSLSGIALQHVMDDARALEAKLKEKNYGSV